MAIQNKTQLKTLSNTTFKDNNNGEIEPAGHRAFNDNLIDSMATAAQGDKADTAIQGAWAGGVEVPQQNNTLYFPPYASVDQGFMAESAIQRATVGGVAVPSVNTTLTFPAYATEAQGKKADTAIQGATMDGVTVPITANILQFTGIGIKWEKCIITESFSYKALYYAILGNALLLNGNVSVGNQPISTLTIQNLPDYIRSRIDSDLYYQTTILNGLEMQVCHFVINFPTGTANSIIIHANRADFFKAQNLIFNTIIPLIK